MDRPSFFYLNEIMYEMHLGNFRKRGGGEEPIKETNKA